jgi:nuclear distribution protein NudE
MLAETKAELDEFHHASKELEAELESELARTEKSQQDLRIKVSKAESERDDWKVCRIFIFQFFRLTSAVPFPKSKFMTLQTAHNTTTTSLQRELDRLRQEYQQLKVQMRELEMGNDDLERNERAVSSSLADMEAKYSRVLEEKILLEHELLEKVSLEEGTQRLKDELRGPFSVNSFLIFILTSIQTRTKKSPCSRIG